MEPSKMHLAPDPSTRQHHRHLPLQLLKLRSSQTLHAYRYQPGIIHRKEDVIILGTAAAIAIYLEKNNKVYPTNHKNVLK